GEPDAGVVVAGDDGDRAPPAGGEAVQELEEEVLGPRRGGERLEDIAGYDRERDLVLRDGRDDLGHDGALLALPRQIAEAPAEVQIRDVKEAHGGRKVAPGGGVSREKLPRPPGAGARARGGSGFFADRTGPRVHRLAPSPRLADDGTVQHVPAARATREERSMPSTRNILFAAA